MLGLLHVLETIVGGVVGGVIGCFALGKIMEFFEW